MTRDGIVGDVATIVGLAEGEAGVRDVIRAVARLEPVAVRSVSRATELPVPFVSAICNELRKRGIVSAQRPVQLTARGRDLFGTTSLRLPLEAACPTCARREIVVPPTLDSIASELAVLSDAAPPVRVEIDQTHCTVETLRGWADTVFTDPPYTSVGASLFLSRAAEATRGRARADVFLAFGPRRPEETLALQRAIAEMGFTVRSLIRNFNDYVGAGSIGGASHLYHLATTSELQPLVEGHYDGPLYTGDARDPGRRYRCKGCGLSKRVGPGQRWATVQELKRDRCPRCRGTAFVPLPRSRTLDRR
jgi:predicted methyltransferase